MVFLQQVGAEISLTSQSLFMGHHSLPLIAQEQVDSGIRRLISAGYTVHLPLDRRKERGEGLTRYRTARGDCDSTPSSARIA
jgi:hypothetical protein